MNQFLFFILHLSSFILLFCPVYLDESPSLCYNNSREIARLPCINTSVAQTTSRWLPEDVHVLFAPFSC
jgi:hypothetical protein